MTVWARNAGSKIWQVVRKPSGKTNDTPTTYVRYQQAVARGHIHVKVFSDTADLLIIPMKRVGALVTGGYVIASCVQEMKAPGALNRRIAGLADIVRGESPFKAADRNISLDHSSSVLAVHFAKVLKDQGISRVVADKSYAIEAFAGLMAKCLQDDGVFVDTDFSSKNVDVPQVKDVVPPAEVSRGEKVVSKGLQTVGKGTEEDGKLDGAKSSGDAESPWWPRLPWPRSGK